jgi:hypothetical protein
MRRLLPLFILPFFLIGITNPAQAESDAQVNLDVDHIFGQEITIQGTIETEDQILDLPLAIQSEDGTLITDHIPLPIDGEIFYALDVSQHPVRAFSYLDIKLDIVFNDDVKTIQLEPYFYDDNRFEWQSLSTEKFTIHWYQPDDDLGQKIINVANDGLSRINSQIEVPEPENIEIYTYSSAREMQETLAFSGQSAAWVAGHADPDLEVIVISLPPGPDQTLEIKRQVPHELVHVLLYQKLEDGYQNLPRWLSEGLASTAELFPNPDYQILLKKAYERDALIPIADLCRGFPLDAATFQLSYAESYDFTWYLQQNFGKTKIDELIQAYADGLGCEQGAEAALGSSLSKLNDNWRELRFGENLMFRALYLFTPWILIAVIVLAAPIGWMVSGIARRKNQKDHQSASP